MTLCFVWGIVQPHTEQRSRLCPQVAGSPSFSRSQGWPFQLIGTHRAATDCRTDGDTASALCGAARLPTGSFQDSTRARLLALTPPSPEDRFLPDRGPPSVTSARCTTPRPTLGPLASTSTSPPQHTRLGPTTRDAEASLSTRRAVRRSSSSPVRAAAVLSTRATGARPALVHVPADALHAASTRRPRNGVENGFTGLAPASRSTGGRAPTRPQRDRRDARAVIPDKVIVVGAHLDSVGTAPGINDNGSGSAGILEIAEQLRAPREQDPLHLVQRRGVRAARLRGLRREPAGQRARKIEAMLNFDMIGSPNFVRFVYDGDLSDSAAEGGAPAGSDEIERPVPRLLRRPRPRHRRLPSTAAPTTGRSSRRGSRPEGCSPAPRASRPPERRRSTAASPGSSTTPATTSAATTSRT